jgi:hypothetical protein
MEFGRAQGQQVKGLTREQESAIEGLELATVAAVLMGTEDGQFTGEENAQLSQFFLGLFEGSGLSDEALGRMVNPLTIKTNDLLANNGWAWGLQWLDGLSKLSNELQQWNAMVAAGFVASAQPMGEPQRAVFYQIGEALGFGHAQCDDVLARVEALLGAR